MQKRVEDIIKKVAQDNSIPEFIAKAIVESQFQCAREAVKKGESGNPATFFNVRFRHLGLLVAKPGKINKLHILKQLKESKNSK